MTALAAVSLRYKLFFPPLMCSSSPSLFSRLLLRSCSYLCSISNLCLGVGREGLDGGKSWKEAKPYQTNASITKTIGMWLKRKACR